MSNHPSQNAQGLEQFREALNLIAAKYRTNFMYKSYTAAKDSLVHDRCSLCHKGWQLNDELIVTKCLHAFHKECLECQFLIGNLLCPDCRVE